MALTPKARQHLKAQAHKLKPIVLVGIQGLTKNVNEEIDRGLYDHELIKIRIHAEDRDDRRALLTEICETHNAELVQCVGKVGVLYRPSDKKNNQ